MSRFGKLLLVATSLAPLLLIYGVPRMLSHSPGTVGFARAAGAVGIAGLLTAIAHLSLRAARRGIQSTPLSVTSVKPADGQVLAFVFTYMLPLLTEEPTGVDLVAAGLFLAILFVVLYQANLMHVNPLLGMLGYHFYEVVSTSGATLLLVSRGLRSTAHAQDLRARRLTDYLWLEVPDDPRPR